MFGNSLSIYVYRVIWYAFQVLARIVGMRRHDLYTLAEDYVFFMFWDMFIVMTFDTHEILRILYEFYCVWKMKSCFKIYVVTSWYQSLGLTDSNTSSGISGLTLRIWEKFSKETIFPKRVKGFQKEAEKNSVYNQPTPEWWFPKIPLRYVLWDIMRYYAC